MSTKVTMTNLEAAQSGDRRRALEVARDTAAKALDECDSNMVAQLLGQYRQTLSEIASLPAAEVVSKRDELAKRRASRASNRGATPAETAPAGRDRKRRAGA